VAVRRCLVLRALGLGDLLTGVPALRALRLGLPDTQVWLAAPDVLAPLVELADAADRLVPTPDLGPVAWSGPAPDLAVDLHGNGPASKVPLQALAPRRFVAFAGPGLGGEQVRGPVWRRDEHERERWCRLVRDALDIPADPADLLLRRPPGALAAGTGPVVVHPGAASGSRRWPADRFAQVATRLATEHPVVVTGSAAEHDLADGVRRAAGLPADALLAGRTDLAELASLVAGARLVVCGDTGTAHLASAFRTPSVVLFGPIPPAFWGPPPEGPHRALWHGRGTETGDPHGAEPDPRLLRISVSEVLASCASLA
jgi:ADP-heptose:LPS heptosyltransferase